MSDSPRPSAPSLSASLPGATPAFASEATPAFASEATPAFPSRATPASRDEFAAAVQRRLRWRARRGLLENDLVLERFFDRHAGRLDDEVVRGLDVLLDLGDGELLDLILQRTQPHGEAATPAARRVLGMLREL